MAIKTFFDFYDDHEKNIGVFVDSIFMLGMTVVIFLGHNVDNFTPTYAYRLFASIFMAFGIWSFEIKNQKIGKMTIDLLAKFFTTILAAVIIARLTGQVKLTGLYSVFYPILIIVLYAVINKKSIWKINGEKKICTSKEFLSLTYGRFVSIIPRVLLFMAIILPGIFNASVTIFIGSLVIAYLLECFFVFVAMKNSKRST